MDGRQRPRGSCARSPLSGFALTWPNYRAQRSTRRRGPRATACESLTLLDLLEILIGGLLQGGVYAAVGVGFSLVYRVTGVVNLSQGSFCVLGAMAMYYFQVVFGWPIAAAIVAAVLSVTVFALIVGLTSFLPAISRLPTSSMLVLTAGLMTFCEGVALIIWGNQPYALPPFSGEAPLVVGPVRLPTQGLWLAGGASVCILGLWWLVNRTRTGQAFLAAAENAVAARLMGVDVERMMLAAFALAAALGALTGVLLAPISSIQFDSGRALSTYGFIAVAIGGIGTFTGAIVGGILLGIAGQLAAFYVSSLFASSLSLVLLLGILVWRPAGLFASGLSRRTDVRVDSQIHRGLVRYSGRVALLFGAVLLVLLAVVPLLPLSPGVMSSATITMIVFLAVLGLDVLMGYAGQVSLGQAAFMAIGGYAAAILTMSFDQAPWLAVVEAMAISVACGVFLTLITSRLRGHYLALATLTFGLLIDSLTVGLIDVTGGPSGLVGVPSLSFGIVRDRHLRQDVLAGTGLRRFRHSPARDRHASRFRSRAEDRSLGPTRGRCARRERIDSQAPGDVRGVGVGLVVRKPLRVPIPFPVARDGCDATILRADRDACLWRRGHPGGRSHRRLRANLFADAPPVARFL